MLMLFLLFFLPLSVTIFSWFAPFLHVSSMFIKQLVIQDFVLDVRGHSSLPRNRKQEMKWTEIINISTVCRAYCLSCLEMLIPVPPGVLAPCTPVPANQNNEYGALLVLHDSNVSVPNVPITPALQPMIIEAVTQIEPRWLSWQILLSVTWYNTTFSCCSDHQERFSYVCPDLVKEFQKYDTDGSKWIKQYTGINAISKKEFTIDVGYERFLGPEIFFHPEVCLCRANHETQIWPAVCRNWVLRHVGNCGVNIGVYQDCLHMHLKTKLKLDVKLKKGNLWVCLLYFAS